MMDNQIIIKGAREHNLKNINIKIPKNKLIVFTGISGSGKSSLAFDTIYAESQRRYIESLSSYARQFLGIKSKPEVDQMLGLSPSIAIDQKSVTHNPRSTVGTVTEIYDYLRLLFAKIGHPHCPKCGREISQQSKEEIFKKIIILATNLLKSKAIKQLRLMILSPIVKNRKGEFTSLFDNLKAKGFQKVRIDNQIFTLSEDFILIKTNRHTIEAVVDQLTLTPKLLKSLNNDILPACETSRPPAGKQVFLPPKSRGRENKKESDLKSRIFDSLEQALNLSDGLIIVSEIKDASFSFPEKPKKFTDHLFSEKFACPACNINLSEIEPRSFSFNSPYGACPNCHGIGWLLRFDQDLILNPRLSINEGGILPFSSLFSQNTWFARIVKTALEKNNINLQIPISQLTPKQKEIFLKGTGEKIYTVEGTNRYERTTFIYEKFEGIIKALEKRYQETESENVRKSLENYMRKEICPQCLGSRLKDEALSITIDQLSIADITNKSIKEAFKWITNLLQALSNREKAIAQTIIKEINNRLSFLLAVGLNYLTLDRSAQTLAGGESQRIRLASQIGSGLSGVLYVLDEPSIGLHLRDNQKLINTLKNLKELGNTVIVVEHDRGIIESADYIVDFGPGGGDCGGEIVASGTLDQIKKSLNSLTGQYLSGKKGIKIKTTGNSLSINKYSSSVNSFLTIKGCQQYNLKNINVLFPLGKLICVTGVSGSGKSTLIKETLYHAVMQEFSPFHREKPGKFSQLQGIEYIDKILLIDQSPIGKTPRSNPATYTNLFIYIREIFAQSKEAKLRGYKKGRFSFNVKGGRCETCEGQGKVKIEMQFLPPIWVVCEVCQGKRFNSETLEVKYKNKNITEVLEMTVDQAYIFFQNIPKLYYKLKTLQDVGLSYIKLGQPAPTLSGGEAQRVKIATELSKKATGKTLYLLDEPTIGLHFHDLEKLLNVLKKLVFKGNTVIIIEHHPEVIKNADWIIDLGPEGGEKGGFIVAQGPPEKIAESKSSYTGHYLKKLKPI